VKVYISVPMSGHENLLVTNQAESGEHRLHGSATRLLIFLLSRKRASGTAWSSTLQLQTLTEEAFLVKSNGRPPHSTRIGCTRADRS
jgi:hypothetical protein